MIAQCDEEMWTENKNKANLFDYCTETYSAKASIYTMTVNTSYHLPGDLPAACHSPQVILIIVLFGCIILQLF